MNLYTTTYEATQPTPKAIDVPLNSKYAVGVEIDYKGEPTIPSTSMTLNGISADGTMNGMAVFNLSSDGNEGRIEYTIAANNDVVATKRIHLYNKINYGESPQGGTGLYLKGDLAECAGITLACAETGYDIAECPFPIIRSDTNNWFMGNIYFTDPTMTTTYAILKRNSNAQRFRFDCRAQGGTIDELYFTIPENCIYVTTGGSVPTDGYLELDTNITKYAQAPQFKLYIDKKDNGKAEGYLDNQVPYGQTISLSGYYDDDTKFNYEVPIKS